ncbi:hypothetical protein [Thalassotalea ganghwensis]
MSQRNNKKHRPYKVSKRSIKDDYIDKQITVIHFAMAKKLVNHPELLPQVHQTLTSYRENGRLSYSGYITWLSILELYDDSEQFIQGVVEESAQMKRLRRSTPFVGILTEAEREKALYEEAIGTISKPDALFL